MTPGALDLPTISRGASWESVVITIKNSLTQVPYNLTGYKAFAHIKHLPTETLILDLLPYISNGSNGEITIPAISRLTTESITVGKFKWDLLLENTAGVISGPWLAGSVTIQNIITNPVGHP